MEWGVVSKFLDGFVPFMTRGCSMIILSEPVIPQIDAFNETTDLDFIIMV